MSVKAICQSNAFQVDVAHDSTERTVTYTLDSLWAHERAGPMTRQGPCGGIVQLLFYCIGTLSLCFLLCYGLFHLKGTSENRHSANTNGLLTLSYSFIIWIDSCNALQWSPPPTPTYTPIKSSDNIDTLLFIYPITLSG